MTDTDTTGAQAGHAAARPRPGAAVPVSAAGGPASAGPLSRAGSAARSTARVARAAAAAMTPLGRCLAGCAVAGLAVGLALGWAEFAALGVTAAVLLAIAAVCLLGRTGHEVQVVMPASRVVVGERAVGTVLVRNRTARSLASAVIEVPVGRNTAEFDVPRLRAGAEHEELFAVPTSRRAVHTIGPARAVRGDPVGILRRQRTWGEPLTLHVHPKTVSLDRVTTGHLRDLDGRPVADLADSDVAFHALREYVRGDELRAVHWKSTARTGTLMVRQYEETRRWHLAIGLSTREADYADEDEFETAVSVAASLGVNALTDARDVTVLTAATGIEARSPRRLLDGLSAVRFGEGRSGVLRLAGDLALEAPDASLAVIVAGSQVGIDLLQRAHARLPLGAVAIAVRVDASGPPRRGRVGDLSVLTVGTLGELPRALRSVSR